MFYSAVAQFGLSFLTPPPHHFLLSIGAPEKGEGRSKDKVAFRDGCLICISILHLLSWASHGATPVVTLAAWLKLELCAEDEN